jgi:hypothetical protein
VIETGEVDAARRIKTEVAPVIDEARDVLRSGYPPMTRTGAIIYGNTVNSALARISAAIGYLGSVLIIENKRYNARKGELLSEGKEVKEYKWMTEARFGNDSKASDMKFTIDMCESYIETLKDLRWDIVKAQEYYLGIVKLD